ncbi:hypothetical protein B4Q13_23005, partial [Lacticaseibacillus rhamnosus]
LAEGHKFVGIGGFAVSDDQNLLAYTVDFTGFRQYSLQVKDLRTGQMLSDTTARVTSLEWAADNKTLFLVTEDEVTKRSDKCDGSKRSYPSMKVLSCRQHCQLPFTLSLRSHRQRYVSPLVTC